MHCACSNDRTDPSARHWAPPWLLYCPYHALMGIHKCTQSHTPVPLHAIITLVCVMTEWNNVSLHILRNLLAHWGEHVCACVRTMLCVCVRLAWPWIEGAIFPLSHTRHYLLMLNPSSISKWGDAFTTLIELIN